MLIVTNTGRYDLPRPKTEPTKGLNWQNARTSTQATRTKLRLHPWACRASGAMEL